MNDTIEKREADLWGDEAQIAERVVEWFDLFVKLRKAADVTAPAELVAQLRRADPAALDAARIWLMKFVFERFVGERDALGRRAKARKAAQSKPCPYTAAEYDAAVARVGHKQELLAAELRVDRKTLRHHRRPPA